MTKSADTHCPYCALQCAMTLTSPADLAPAARPGPGPAPALPSAPALEVAGRDFPTNRGGLCRKGWTSPALLNHAGRITEPLLKGPDGVHRPISWDRALDLAAQLRTAGFGRFLNRDRNRVGTHALFSFGDRLQP